MLRKAQARAAMARYMVDALGEPRCVADRLAGSAIRHARVFARDADRLARGNGRAPWRGVDVSGPMFYRSYMEMAEPDQGLVIAMPHLGCYASALFHLHQFSPVARPICAWRQSVARGGNARMFGRLGTVGPPVRLLGEAEGAAVKALSVLRRAGVLVSFIDVVSGHETEVNPVAGQTDPVELLGRPAVLSDAAVRVGALAHARLVFVHAAVRGDRLCVNVAEPADLSPASTAVTMRRLAGQLERAIQATPEQWLHWLFLGEMWKQGTIQSTRTSSTKPRGTSS